MGRPTGQGSQPRSGERVFTRFIQRTLLVRAWITGGVHMIPRWKVILRDYGEGDAEVSWGASSGAQRQGAERGKSKNRERNIERCNRRAKGELRRKVMSGGLDHLLTLTFRENVQDKDEATRYFQKFVRLVHRYKPDWKYAEVPERQERGALHFHMGVKGYQDVTLLRSLWRSVVGEGNVDVQYKKTGKGHQWRKAKLASYLCKYIGKDMVTELNEKRYRVSPGIVVPEEVIYLRTGTSAKDYALFKLQSVAGKIGFVWCPEESYGQYGWACSWG